MSVIQEALRRKMAEQAEKGIQQTPVAGPPPATNYQQANAAPQPQPAPASTPPRAQAPAPAYAPPQPIQQPAERSASWFVLLFLFLLAGGAAALFYVQSRQMLVETTVSQPTVAPLPQQVTLTANAPVVDSGITVEEAMEETAAALTDEEPRVAAESAPVAVDQAENVKQPAEPSRAVAQKQATVTRDDWPRIELMGILSGNEDKRSTAILNGALVMLNAEIDGVTLADVGEDGVYLEFKGDRQFIRIGEYTR